MSYHFQDYFWEGSGFDDLHRYMKNGTEFCKEFESVLSERSDVENVYVKGLHKIVKKARLSSKRLVGTMEPAWGKMVLLLEAEEEAHRTLAGALSAECAKVLKAFNDQQIKQREQLEIAVDKQHKLHLDKQNKQTKNKRTAFKTCRDLESSWSQLKDIKRSGTEKDIQKLEKTYRKLEESLMKADREYRDSNIKTEQCRLGWESAMYQCCRNDEVLEQERLNQIQSILTRYSELVEASMPPVQEARQAVVGAAEDISVEEDLESACTTYGTGPNQPEQILIDCFDEDMRSNMDGDRRQASLERKIQYIEQEIERQQKAKAGIEQLSKVYQEQPDFVDEKGADDVNRQLIEADSMLNLLKANHYKLLCSHAETSNGPRPSSQFGQYIKTTTDKHGQTVSMLKIPIEEIGYLEDDYQPGNYEKSTRKSSSTKKSLTSSNGDGAYGGGGAYGGDQKEPVEEAFQDEEYDQDPEFEENEYVGECKVLYAYEAQQSDELTINIGDTLNIVDKYDPEWWQGELNGTVGIFPATYVEEI